MRKGGSVSGAVSLVVIFCALCLAVFATLTLSTALREQRLSQLAADRAAASYDADSEAMEIVNALRLGLPTDAFVLTEPDPAGQIANFSVPAGGEQVLEVSVLLSGDEATILRWQTVYGGSWETDDHLTLWSGD